MDYKMELTPEQADILAGGRGETMARIMRTLVRYGDVFGADRMVAVTAPGHLVTSFGISVMSAYFDVMQEIIDAGIAAERPFTVDPRPIDDRNVPANLIQKIVAGIMYGKQADYEKQLEKLGIKDTDAFSCTCYMDEVGNRPARGDILSWAESSAVVYANSVLGARCNRNSAFIDLFGSILGFVPNFGLLTDEGRRAEWIVEVKTSSRPEAQLLGSAIGLKVMEAVPYIKGMDTWLGSLDAGAEAYLKDMGAATASNGAVGLYHVEGITPEAVELGDSLIRPDARTYVIDDAELERVKASYPVMWKRPGSRPRLAFIGCPHLSIGQLKDWTERIEGELERQGRAALSVPTVLSAAPGVLKEFEGTEYSARLHATGARTTYICPLMYMNNPMCKSMPVITCSNKLRTYTTARYFTESELLGIIVKGGI